MWSILNGTIVNSLTVVIGSTIGLSVGHRIHERYHQTILMCLGLVTLGLGMDAAVVDFGRVAATYQIPGVQAYGARLALVVVGSLIFGGLIGTFIGIQRGIERLGDRLKARFGSDGDHRFTEGFLTASVIFCVGPLTLLGCLENGGPDRDPSLLYIKSLLDGFCSMALASTMGLGVAFSVLFVFGFQGGLALLSYAFIGGEETVGIALMSSVGGYLLLATGLLLLKIKEMPVANLLPGILLPPAVVAIVEWIRPGVLVAAAVTESTP